MRLKEHMFRRNSLIWTNDVSNTVFSHFIFSSLQESVYIVKITEKALLEWVSQNRLSIPLRN